MLIACGKSGLQNAEKPPNNPQPLEDDVDEEMIERAAKAILSQVPLGYGMHAEEARVYARVAIEVALESAVALELTPATKATMERSLRCARRI
jgi:hypothetical protein